MTDNTEAGGTEVEMPTRMEFTGEVDELAKALHSVQGEVADPPRRGENPHFGSSYVTLEDLIHAVRPVLSEHGIVLIQSPGMENGHVTVETVLLHESGQSVRSLARSPAQKNDPQGVGSAVTYLRRYALSSMLGVVSEDDDDAERAVQRDGGKREHGRKMAGAASEKQIGFIRGLMDEREVPEDKAKALRQRIKAWKADPENWPKKKASNAIEYLQGLPEADESDEQEELPLPDDRLDVEGWFEDRYGDEADTKLRLALSRHPIIQCGGEPDNLEPSQWEAFRRQCDEHGLDAMVEEPAEVI